jgi:hypothetical protein
MTNDPSTYLVNYISYGSFGQALKAAHAERGSGHTFSHGVKFFPINRAVGGFFRKNLDNHQPIRLLWNEVLRGANASIKEFNPNCNWLDQQVYP